MNDGLHVATFNLRNTHDRWDARLPLILAEMETLQPDLLGLQECVFPLHQDRLVGAAGPAHYRVHRGWAAEAEIGNSLLVREPLAATEPARLDLGRGRSAIRAMVALDRSRISTMVTQLHHVAADRAVRDEQVARLIGWLDADPESDAQVVLGDFNAAPDEPAYERMTRSGFRSAHAEANGREPEMTWPTGLGAEHSGGRARRQGYWLEEPDPGTEDPGCFDYIWVRGAVRVESCRLAFDRPAGDPTLYPSDRFGIAARLR